MSQLKPPVSKFAQQTDGGPSGLYLVSGISGMMNPGSLNQQGRASGRATLIGEIIGMCRGFFSLNCTNSAKVELEKTDR